MKKIGLILILISFIFSSIQLCMADEYEREIGDASITGSFKTGLFTPADEDLRPDSFWTYGFEVEGDVVVFHERTSLSFDYYYLTADDKNFDPVGDFSIHNIGGKFNVLLTKNEDIAPLNFWVGFKHLRVNDDTSLFGEDNGNFTGVGFGLEKKADMDKKFDFTFDVGYYPVLEGGSEINSLDSFEFELGANIKFTENWAIQTSYFYERWHSDVDNQFLLYPYGLTVQEGTSTLKGLKIGINGRF